jgi:NAD(P)H dehydrogenase (quinone)
MFLLEATTWQVAETLPEEALAKMHAPAKRDAHQHPVISGKRLADADGVLFGFPLRRRRALQVEPRY